VTMTPAMHRVLRPLNDYELETVLRALEMLADTKDSHAWSARTMIDQKMAQRFWWMKEEL
jgi:hypothetical protein